MNRRLCVYISAAVMAALLGISGCRAGERKKEDTGKPTVVVLWHSYNAVAKSAFDDLVMEFNETVGMEQGIIVEPVGYGSSNELDDVLYASASHVIGSEPLPDIFASYPDSAYRLDGIAPLVRLDGYFSEDELDAYRPEFLAEGVWGGDGMHRMVPVAKSTELLLMNQTRLDAFLDANPRYREENMESWEGLERMAEGYFRWTDDMTPETDGDGSPFIGVDNLANYFVAMNHAMGSDIYHYDENGVVVPDLDRDIIERLFLNYYQPFTKGYYGAKGRYRSDDVKQSYLAGCIGSSSSVLYFPEEVADSEGNMVPVTTGVYQYPVMEGTTPTAIQQGAGVAVFNRSHEENKAALDFIHWLTIDRGFELATSMSYMPVDNGAMTEEQGRQIDDARVLKGIETGLKQSSSYQMVYGFDFENSYDVRTEVDACFSEALSRGCMEFEEYLGQGMSMDEAAASMDYGRKADAFYEQVKAIFEE